jgi:hypothetical protein
MKRLIPLLFLILPVGLFAQGGQGAQGDENALLKKFGLKDAQVTQVLDIQGKAKTTIEQDAAQLKVLHAQMDKALLPANPNMDEVNGDITQISQVRTDLMKTFVGAKVQIRQIIGDDNFPAFARFLKHKYGLENHRVRFGMLGANAPLKDRGAQ